VKYKVAVNIDNEEPPRSGRRNPESREIPAGGSARLAGTSKLNRKYYLLPNEVTEGSCLDAAIYSLWEERFTARENRLVEVFKRSGNGSLRR
jgi:hypothetical protein